VSGYAAGEAFERSAEAFGQAVGWLSGAGAAGLGLAGLEKGLAARVREVTRLLLQDHLSALAAAEPRLARVTGPDGVVRTRSEAGHERTVASVFGPVVVSRIAYRAPGAAAVHPLDAELGLPRGRHSHGLAEMTASEAVRVALEQVCVQVRIRTGCKLGTRQAQQLVRQGACDFGSFYASRPAALAVAGEVVVLVRK
jgi:hypothetical protein